MKILLFVAAALFLSACSFNKKFLQPTKIPADKEEFKLPYGADTINVLFGPNTHQPTFLRNGRDTVNFNFTIESVVFKSSSGNNLNGWLLKPKNTNPAITLLHFHGNSGFLVSQYLAMVPLLKYGFQIFTFDYSGFGFSEGKATRDNVLLDGNSALTYIKSRDDVKNTKLVIYGQSLGGHLAAVVAQQRQADIDGLVVEGAFSSHKDIAAKTAGIFGRILVSEKYSAYKSIHKYKKPVLVIHSDEDKTVPFKMGQSYLQTPTSRKNFMRLGNVIYAGLNTMQTAFPVRLRE